MLPDGFCWKPRYQYDRGPNAVFCRSLIVSHLDQRIDGSWIACLNGRTRRCTGYEAGRAGCEAWVTRHQDRLRVEAAENESRLPMRPWLPRPAGTTGASREALVKAVQCSHPWGGASA